jgi:hypothetical protein
MAPKFSTSLVKGNKGGVSRDELLDHVSVNFPGLSHFLTVVLLCTDCDFCVCFRVSDLP